MAGAIKVASRFNMILTAGKATPQPPVGSALGQRGLNLMNFCKAFNDETAKFKEVPMRASRRPVIATLRPCVRLSATVPAGPRHCLLGPHLHV